jgi:BirA family transcriptional regulator, biotin operon repressor / biotin---[acetyl-CoA-carboxylase] ligase
MSDFTIIELDTIDSTNNYAMQLINANKAQHGLTIVAGNQTAGKGQRGRTWANEPGKNLLMSIIVYPRHQINEQFAFNASIAVAIANVLQKLFSGWQISIKWPNDILINDKKAGGILIENVLRGSKWTHSVIGFGLNVNQESFAGLPFATSLKNESGSNYEIATLRNIIQKSILAAADNTYESKDILAEYNGYLYKRGKKQSFSNEAGNLEVTILNARPDGTLEVQMANGDIAAYHHGQMMWDWQ